MTYINEAIKGIDILEVGGNGFVRVGGKVNSSAIRLKSSGEVGDGGVNGFVEHWYGFDLWLSNSTLAATSSATGLATVVLATWAP